MKERSEAPPLPPMTLAKVLDPRGRDEAEQLRAVWRRTRGMKRFFCWCLFVAMCGTTGLSFAAMVMGPEKVSAIFKGDWHTDAFTGGGASTGFSFLPDESSSNRGSSSSGGGSAATPEPSSFVLAGMAAFGAAAMFRRQRNRRGAAAA